MILLEIGAQLYCYNYIIYLFSSLESALINMF